MKPTDSSRAYTPLSREQAEQSRALYGPNVLTLPPSTPEWKLFLRKFTDPLIVVLLVAGVCSICISAYEYWWLGQSAEVFFEPVGIFVAVLIATTLSFVFERRADKEFKLLNSVNDREPVQVIRAEGATSVPRCDVVVGDIIVLNTGDEIPADAELLDSTALEIDESTLTGEPSTHKSHLEEAFEKEATFPTDHVLKGTKVLSGHGLAKVYAVGNATEAGKVYKEAQIDDGRRSPLDEQLDRLGAVIAKFSYGIAAAVVVARLLGYLIGAGWHPEFVSIMAYAVQTLMIGVALVAVSVPEGLPMAVALSLALSMRRMLRTGSLVRKLHACETMGAADVICTDKTGTLTRNRMSVAAAMFAPGVGEDVIARSIAANSTARLGRDASSGAIQVLGNPTEGALLLWLDGRGENAEKIRESLHTLAEVPFSTERKYMATLTEDGAGRRELHVKGAPEIVLAMCKSVAAGLSREDVESALADYQRRGMRTLGFAYAPDATPGQLAAEGLAPDARPEFMGIVAISDPVRDDVPAAIAQCTRAGIGVKIVTGDTPATAREIASEIGLWTDSDADSAITTGPAIAAMTDEELTRAADGIKIVARARPLDKKRLVDALRRLGHVVAVTGDGTNDAPALNDADVGLSMGDGTAVAKEASDITITDNSFASIGRAVMWGRSLYLNIRRFITFQLTVNVVACLIVLIGAMTGRQSPLTVTQMLWVNLIMDTFAALALASLPPSVQVMSSKPRRRSDFIISASMARTIVGVGLFFTAVLLGLLWFFRHYEVDALTAIWPLHRADSQSLSPYELSLFFTIFVFLQFWNLFNVRAEGTTDSAFRLSGCWGFLFTLALILVGQVLIVSFGGRMFGVVPLSLTDWLLIIGGTSVVMWAGEAWRWARRALRREA